MASARDRRKLLQWALRQRLGPLVLVLILIGGSASVFARGGFLADLMQAWNSRPVSVAPAGTLEIGFSPDEGAEDLVLKVIRSARRELRLQAYSFTSAKVVDALLEARRRGVDVRVVVDQRANLKDERGSKARAALATLVNARVPLRTVSEFAIHHDKVIIIDRETVQTGSYNYSEAAAHANSENVLVVWGNPALAARYLAHWQSRWDVGEDWQPGY